jgi:hypothetical protein
MSLLFSPETRAQGLFSTYEAAQITSLEAIPLDTRELLHGRGVVADVTTGGSGLTEAISWRGVFDPTAYSGLSGLTTGRYCACGRTSDTADILGQTMLHELGHGLDYNYLPAIGYPDGITGPTGNGAEPYTETYYWPDGITIETIIYYTAGGHIYLVQGFDESGTQVSEDTYSTPPDPPAGYISSEQAVIELFEPHEGDGGYYRSLITEWVAQMCMLFWAERIDGFTATSYRNGLITDIGGSGVYDDFVSYMQGIGAFPT